MATIQISNLKPTGYELFSDSESYMIDLSDNELGNVNGGILLPTVLSPFNNIIVDVAVAGISGSSYQCFGNFFENQPR